MRTFRTCPSEPSSRSNVRFGSVSMTPPPMSTVSPISSSAMSVVSGTYSTSSSTRSTVPRSPTWL